MHCFDETDNRLIQLKHRINVLTVGNWTRSFNQYDEFLQNC